MKTILMSVLAALALSATCFAQESIDCRSECRKKTDREEMRLCMLGCAEKTKSAAREAEPKTIDLADVTAWKNIYERKGSETASEIRRRPGGGYVLCGNATNPNTWANDALLMEIDEKGRQESVNTYSFGEKFRSTCRAVSPLKGGGNMAAVSVYDPSIDNISIVLTRINKIYESDWMFEITEDGKNNFPASLQTTDDGGIVFAGKADSFTKHKNDLFVARVDEDKKTKWLLTAGTTDETDEILSLEKTSDGGFIAAGYLYIQGKYTDFAAFKISPDGKTQWEFIHGYSGPDFGISAIEVEDGNFIMIGLAFDEKKEGLAYELVKFKNGKLVWKKRWDFGKTRTGLSGVARLTSDGNYLFAADIYDENKNEATVIAKTNPSGSLLWSGVLKEPYFADIAVDPEGGFLVAYSSESGYETDLAVLKIDDSKIIQP